MSTNEELVRGLDSMSKNPRTRSEHREFLAECRDALEQTTLERNHHERQHKQAGALLQDALVAQKQADATVAKVRTYAQGRVGATKREILALLDESASRPAPIEPSELIHCDYCGGALPSVLSRAHVPTTPDLQRRGFAADKVVCPECAAAPAPTEEGEREALAAVLRDNVIAAGGGRAFKAADVILAAGFRRAPIEDADDYEAGYEEGFAHGASTPNKRRLPLPIEVTDEMVERFKAAWGEANADGDAGNRVRRGLNAAFKETGKSNG